MKIVYAIIETKNGHRVHVEINAEEATNLRVGDFVRAKVHDEKYLHMEGTVVFIQ